MSTAEFNKLFEGYPLEREEVQRVMQGFRAKLHNAIPILQAALNNAGEAQYDNPDPLHRAMEAFDGVVQELNTNATLAIVDAVREYSLPYIEASALYKSGGTMMKTEVISWDLFYQCRDAMFYGIIAFTQWVVSVTPNEE